VRLLPKDEKFWGFFIRQTASISKASQILFETASAGNAELAGAAVRIKAIERESARTLRELQVRLHKTFVTPIDPEDISLLSEHLDHLLDDLEAISYRLSAYHLEPVPATMIELAKRTHTCAELAEKAFGLLSIDESTEELCNRILLMEEETDQSIREAVTRLFAEEQDAIAVMKKKEIYDIFERLSDSYQDLANVLQNVSIKNS